MVEVELRNVSNYALRSVSIKFDDGLLSVVLGPNGAGKTTLLKVIAGLVGYKGSVLFDGVEVDHLPPEKRNIGYVPQTLALFHNMTVEENIAFGLKVRNLPKSEVERRVCEVMELLEIVHLRDRYPRKLSVGEQQRVAIARALAINPKILLLDEPFTNIQSNLRKQLRSEIRKLHRKLKITTIFVTHDLMEAEELGEKIAVINNGRIVGTGSFKQMLPVISKYIQEANILSGDVLENYDFGLAKIKCGNLELIVPLEESFNEEITVTIPPERIVLTKISPPIKVNTFKAEIKELSEHRGYVRIVVMACNQKFIIHTAERIANLGIGDQVYIKIPIRHIKVVK